MKKYVTGAFLIVPMIEPKVCIRLNTWLHSRHCYHNRSPLDDKGDLANNTLFGFYSPYHSWDMLPLMTTVDHMRSHGIDPYKAPHLVGTFQEDQELNQAELKMSFACGQPETRIALEQYNKMSFPISDSFISNLSIVNDPENNRSFLCWDQVNKVSDMDFWLKQVERILNELEYKIVEGVMIEDNDDPVMLPRLYHSGSEGVHLESFYYSQKPTFEEELLKAMEQSIQQGSVSSLPTIDRSFLEVPEPILRDWEHYSGTESCCDPLRYFTKQELLEDFLLWLHKKVDAGTQRFASFKQKDDSIDCEKMIREINQLEKGGELEDRITKELFKGRYDMDLVKKIDSIIYPF